MNPGQVARDLAAIALGEAYEQPRARKMAKLDPKVYDALLGRSQVEPQVIATIPSVHRVPDAVASVR